MVDESAEQNLESCIFKTDYPVHVLPLTRILSVYVKLHSITVTVSFRRFP